MIKKNWIYILFGCSVLLFAFTQFKSKLIKVSDDPFVTMSTFRTPAGWGYDILKDDSIYIHQAFIPATEGRKGFDSEDDAYTIGNLVVAKMKHSALPVISLGELDSCNIKR